MRWFDSRSDRFVWQTFLDTPPEEHDYESSRFVVIPVPYDGTTSFRTGARYGPAAIIDASRHLEDFDIELGIDPSTQGIFTLPEIVPDASGPRAVIEQVCDAVGQALDDGTTPVVLGGEHTVTIGAVSAAATRFPDLSVLYLDAHADSRDSFMGTRWGHASVARRVSELCPLVAVGIRSMSMEEYEFAQSTESANEVTVHTWPPHTSLPHTQTSSAESEAELISSVHDSLTNQVYISVDLDVLDPSIMPAVGTPEPGGMSWWEILRLLKAVTSSRKIVGFDVVELSPEEGPVACSSTAARLVYKIMGYMVFGER